ncbi:MAG: hypothetical protein ACI8Y3_001548 [Paraglaciecola sp.]|jgi:hypothetical protein
MIVSLSFSNFVYSSSDILDEDLSIDANSQFEELFSYEGYPYDLLIRHADKIKINYIVKGEEVTCSVSMEDKELDIKSSSKVVSLAQFDSEPLVSCLVRSDAKKWLSRLF